MSGLVNALLYNKKQQSINDICETFIFWFQKGNCHSGSYQDISRVSVVQDVVPPPTLVYQTPQLRLHLGPQVPLHPPPLQGIPVGEQDQHFIVIVKYLGYIRRQMKRLL